ncbi:MAG TPA: hypothetical protein DDW52_19480, partial [Planctomycetaceae bacterium]|nr:hypothetical protein [Planctomycetaceae bacterium]
ELADGQTPEYRRNLLNKLEASAARMPRLVGVETMGKEDSGLSTAFSEEFRERVLSAASNEERRAIVQGIMNSGAFRLTPAAPAMSTDQTLIAYPVVRTVDDDSELPSGIDEIRVWDVATGSWTGKTIRPELPVARVAVHPEKRLVAAFLFEANDGPNSNGGGQSGTSLRPPTNNPLRAKGKLALAVWSIDSGDLFLQHEVANDVPDPRRGLRPLQFRSDGTEIVAVTGTVATAEGVPVTVFSSTSGDVIRETHFRPVGSGGFVSQISPDGRRLIMVSAPFRFGADRLIKIACYDIDTGEQVGNTLETESLGSFGRGNLRPTILTPDGSSVAVFSGVGKDQQIEILDFETGGQIGGAIDVPRADSSTIFKLNANSAGTQLAVSTVPSGGVERLRQSTDIVLVHVFDVETGTPIAPPLPVSERVNFVAMPDKCAALSVDLNGTIQTWQLPHSQLHRVVFPWQGLAMQSSVPPFIRNRSIDFTNQLSTALRMARGTRASVSTLDTFMLTSPSIELAIDQQGHVLAAEKDQSGISLKVWDRQTGRLLSTKKLANTESSFVGMFSPGSEYLLTGYVGDGPDATAFVQVWRTTTCTKHGEAFEFTKGVPEDTPLAISPDGLSLLLRRREGTGRQADFSVERAPNGEFRMGHRTRRRLTPVYVDLTTGEETILPAPANRFAGQFSADGRFVLLDSPTRRWRYSLEAGKFVPPLDAAENAPVIPSRRRESSGRFGPLTSRLTARSGDGMLTATIIDNSVVQIHRVGSNDRVGREEDQLVELSHPSPVVSVAFDPESKLVVTAAADGLIRHWPLPQRWTGIPEEILHRVQRHTGIALAESDRVVVVEDLPSLNRTEQNSDDRQTLRGDVSKLLASSATNFATRDEIDAIRLRITGRWEEADAALAGWASLRPDDWQPHALRLRTLIELRKFDEADAEWNETKR